MKDNNKFKHILFLFKVFYLVYLLLAFNAFVNGMAWMNAASYILTFAGLLLIIWMFYHFRRYKNAYNIWILGAFVISYIISATLHISYGVLDNIKGLIWLVIPLFLAYFTAFDMSGEEIHRELKWLLGVYVVYCTVANIVSLTMLYWGRNYDYKDGTGMIHGIGYRWNRLWGIYDDPNHGATITVIAILWLIFVFFRTKRTWKRILGALCFLINYIYIVLSDSRTGVVTLVAGIAFAGIISFWMRRQNGRGMKHSLVPLMCAMVAVSVLFVGTNALNLLYQSLDKKPVTSHNTNSSTKPMHPSKPARTQELHKDYSNGRIEIWKNGLQIAESSPAVGVGYRNIVGYSKEHFPQSYMVKNNSGVQYDSMHNLELDILVSQGGLGGVIFLAFIVNICVILFKKVHFAVDGYTAEVVFSVATAGALLIAGTFLSFIFYVNAPQNLCFWLFLGYGMRFCQIGEKAKV